MVNDAMLQLNFEKTNKQEKKIFPSRCCPFTGSRVERYALSLVVEPLVHLFALTDSAHARRILRIRWDVRIMKGVTFAYVGQERLNRRRITSICFAQKIKGSAGELRTPAYQLCRHRRWFLWNDDDGISDMQQGGRNKGSAMKPTER